MISKVRTGNTLTSKLTSNLAIRAIVNGEGDEGTERYPVGVSEFSVEFVIFEDFPDDSPKNQVDDPNDDGTHEGETREKGCESLRRAVA